MSALTFSSGGVSIPMYAQEVEPASATRQPAILLLHGSGGHIDFWTSRLAPFLREGNIGLYAPHYFERTQTTRADFGTITDGVHVPKWLDTLNDALRFVAARPSVDPTRIVIAGISLGSFLALAFAAQLCREHPDDPAAPSSPRRIRALLDISGGLAPPYDTLVNAHMPPVLILHGDADPIVPVSFAHDLDRILTSFGVDHTTEILAGEGHWFSPAALPRILLSVSAFLQRHLRR